MEIIETKLPGVFIIKQKRFDDNRGWFMETYNKTKSDIQFDSVQDNVSFTEKAGTIRGMHLQAFEHSQGKIVTCVRGKILDVVVDLRKNSPTYLQKIEVELSEDNHYQLVIPRGFAHGFQTLTDNVMFMYKCDNAYNKESERCIHYLDKTLDIHWPIKDVTISEKDNNGLSFEEYNNSLTKILITGGSGLLGSALKKYLESKKYTVYTPSSSEMNITDSLSVNCYIYKHQPDIVIHCAAYTNVNGAEKEREKCNLVNVVGTANISRICKLLHTKLAYISTEYVFDGTKEGFYLPSDYPNPVNHYGFTKELGEKIVRELPQHYIIRTSWLYDNYGNCFPSKIVDLASRKKSLTVVDDQIGSPTYVEDLAQGIEQVIKTDDYGTYHLTNKDYCSFYELAKKVCEIKGLDVEIKPISTEEFQKNNPESVKRPKNSRMKDDLHNIPMPNYEDALIRCLKKDNH